MMDIKPTPPPGPDGRPNLGYDEASRLAKKWGSALGYKGRAGGWVYGPSGRPVCQGWYALWLRCWRRILTEKGA